MMTVSMFFFYHNYFIKFKLMYPSVWMHYLNFWFQFILRLLFFFFFYWCFYFRSSYQKSKFNWHQICSSHPALHTHISVTGLKGALKHNISNTAVVIFWPNLEGWMTHSGTVQEFKNIARSGLRCVNQRADFQTLKGHDCSTPGLTDAEVSCIIHGGWWVLLISHVTAAVRLVLH